MSDTRIGVDVGGTFTDLVALSEGAVTTAKVPSTPQDQSAGVMNAIHTSEVEPEAVFALAHGMTVATNALLERRGARTALVTTEGFRDILEIARQNRPSLYDLTQDRPPTLVPRELRFTVKERMGPEGEVEPLDEESLQSAISAVREAEVEAVAVCLLFAFMHPEHEKRAGAALREALTGLYVSLSSEGAPAGGGGGGGGPPLRVCAPGAREEGRGGAARSTAGLARLALERGSAGVQGVRAVLDDRRRRLPGPEARRISQEPGRQGGGGRYALAPDHAVRGRGGHHRGRGGGRRGLRPLGTGGRGRGRGLRCGGGGAAGARAVRARRPRHERP